MNLVDELQAEATYQKALAECDKELCKFRSDNLIVIGELINKQMYHDLTRIFFKQGFLSGMKFSNNEMKK